jgi:hypothetical protein
VELPFLLTGEQLEALEEEAGVSGLTVAELIRQLVLNYLAGRRSYPERKGGGPCSS